MKVPTAPCGLECGDCLIFQAAKDSETAKRLAENWRESGRKEAVPEWFQCQGCYGEPSARWSQDCAIRKCCVDERAMTSCSRCREFPCAKLSAWAGEGAHHAMALDRLRTVRQAAEIPR